MPVSESESASRLLPIRLSVLAEFQVRGHFSLLESMPEQAHLNLDFSRSYLLDAFPSEAEARGELFRLLDLARAREADGLEPSDAELEAAQSLGLDLALNQVLEAAFEPVLSLGDLSEEQIPAWWEHGECWVKVRDTRGNLPTLRRTPLGFNLWLPAAPIQTLAVLAAELVHHFVEKPERTVATVDAGPGGSGGCACGDELPEDSLAGPLFRTKLAHSRFAGF